MDHLGTVRRRGLTPLAAVAATALLLGACGGGDDPAATGAVAAETVTLTYSGFSPETATMMQSWQWYADEVEERSGGAVEFESFYGGSLLGAVEGLAGVRDGRVDLAHIGPQYHATEFPLSHVIGVPFVTDDPVALARTLKALYNENELLRAEYEAQGVHVLNVQVIGPSMLGMSRPVEAVSDLRGASIRSTGLLSSVLQGAGASTEGLEVSEVYEAMQRGVLDGFAALPFDLAPALALDEVATHIIHPGTGVYNVALDTISLEVWEGLPEDVRAVMEEVSDDYVEAATQLVVDAEVAACDALLEAGVTVSVLPEDEVTRWEELVGSTAVDEWLGAAGAAGIASADADSFLEEYLAAIERYDAESDYVAGMTTCAERSS